MPSLPPVAQDALTLARAGDFPAAIAAAQHAVSANPDDFGLRLFLTQLHSSVLDLEGALPHVRHALRLVPGDPLARIELIRLLIGLGRLDQAEEELGVGPLPGFEPVRLQAVLLVRRDRPGAAIPLLRQIVTADPKDHESWGNLGGCHLAMSQPGLAAQAFAHAAELRPDLAKYRDKMIEAQVRAGDGEAALAAARAAVDTDPHATDVRVTIARIEALLERREAAMETLRSALDREPGHVQALLAFADLLERANRIDELSATIERLVALDPKLEQLPLLRARLALRQGRFEEAIALARSAPELLDRGLRAELIGRAEDRLGHHDAAFASFTAMNQESELSKQTIANRSAALRDLIDQRAAQMTSNWVSGWSPTPHRNGPRDPAFLIGFPRSGTTLLDTFLMGHPEICIAEERPMLQAVSAALGPYERIASLGEAEIAGLRATYFEAAAAHAPELGDRLLIDKYPLGAIDVGIVHRLFPNARIIFAERHPCDVILSCYFTRFQPTATLISFFTIDDSARLYDRVMSLWERARTVMPLRVHNLRYEGLVADPEAKMRPLIDFLGLEWDPATTSHESAAAGRGLVTSASYAQVLEPLYDRSIGRWKSYRRHLEPVLPILAPWIEKLGYGI